MRTCTCGPVKTHILPDRTLVCLRPSASTFHLTSGVIEWADGMRSPEGGTQKGVAPRGKTSVKVTKICGEREREREREREKELDDKTLWGDHRPLLRGGNLSNGLVN